jgi:hypothetical protein
VTSFDRRLDKGIAVLVIRSRPPSIFIIIIETIGFIDKHRIYYSTAYHYNHQVYHLASSKSIFSASSARPIDADYLVDYLTVLATRSLVFFPLSSPFSHPISPNSNASSSSSPNTTPESRSHFLNPEPVTLPLQSLAWADRQCALFLLDHFLATALPSYESPSAYNLSSSPGTISHMDKKLMADAEGLVWKEVEKGKEFVRAVGEWFGAAGAGGISDAQLKVLARGCGVEIKDEDEEYGHGHGHGHREEEHRLGEKTESMHSVHEVVFA